jgi:hypothetical protein
VTCKHESREKFCLRRRGEKNEDEKQHAFVKSKVSSPEG